MSTWTKRPRNIARLTTKKLWVYILLRTRRLSQSNRWSESREPRQSPLTLRHCCHLLAPFKSGMCSTTAKGRMASPNIDQGNKTLLLAMQSLTHAWNTPTKDFKKLGRGFQVPTTRAEAFSIYWKTSAWRTRDNRSTALEKTQIKTCMWQLTASALTLR